MQPPEWTQGPQRGSLVVGVLLVVVGAYFLAREYIPELDWGRIWPVALVIGGALLLVGSLRRRD